MSSTTRFTMLLLPLAGHGAEAVCDEIARVIETFHNRARQQARLGHRTPNETYTASAEAA